MICYYYLNNVNGIITKVDEIPLSVPSYQHITSYNGFSCQIMKSDTKGEVLTCFFHVNERLYISSYDINTFGEINELIHQSDSEIQPIFISSALSGDKTKSLVCYLKNWQFNRCDKYNINDNSLTLVYEEITKQCNNQNPSLNFLYTTRGYDEYIFGCYGYNYDYNLIKLNSNFEVERIINNYLVPAIMVSSLTSTM